MSFPIVGIGASAGGLESISALLAGIPASTGMAYVFVQHLDPGHASHLAKILSKRAALPVEEAREGEILPDHLYVIIPNITLTITGHVLHLRSRDPAEKPHRPIDILFLSLAEKRGPNVIGVILSGSGSDGAKGIQAIKEAGGVTFAEEENSASFFGMPRSAIQTGCVDFILNPRDIAQGLIGINRQYRWKTTHRSAIRVRIFHDFNPPIGISILSHRRKPAPDRAFLNSGKRLHILAEFQ